MELERQPGMFSGSPNHLWTFLFALLALGCEAVFTWPELVQRSPGDLGIAPMVVGVVCYLLSIGHAIYVRYHRNHVPSGMESLPRNAHPMLWWMGTIGVVGALSLVLGLGFPQVMGTRLGAFVVEALIMGLVALGLVITVSGPPRFGPAPVRSDLPKPPSFLRSVLRLVTYQLGARLGAVVLFGPVYLVMTGFDRWIDIPACKRLCASHGFSFDSFHATKTTYDCVCATASGLSRFHDRAYVTGGHGFFAWLVDWLVRSGTMVVVVVVWVVTILVIVVWVGRKKGIRWEARPR
jgi:hypothetical protein